jgi:hypothetical protein
VQSLERSVFARSIVGSAGVVAAVAASSARARAVQRCAVCAAGSHAQAAGAAAWALQGLRTNALASARKWQRERAYKRCALARGQCRRRAHESPRERGRAKLGAASAAQENEGISQCLFARSAVAAKASASRSGQQYRAVPRALPNPSIERTSKRLRLFAAAHVER